MNQMHNPRLWKRNKMRWEKEYDVSYDWALQQGVEDWPDDDVLFRLGEGRPSRVSLNDLGKVMSVRKVLCEACE
jgi:hypothetical protein